MSITRDMHWKNPPEIKVYEALGALADGRMENVTETGAIVWSSDRSKHYDVSYDPQSGAIMANDNGSYWQGYLGYPSIAFLMVRDLLPYNALVAEFLRGVLWKKINVSNKNDYQKTIADILSGIHSETREKVSIHVQEIMIAITSREWKKFGKRVRPPRQNG